MIKALLRALALDYIVERFRHGVNRTFSPLRVLPTGLAWIGVFTTLTALAGAAAFYARSTDGNTDASYITTAACGFFLLVSIGLTISATAIPHTHAKGSANR